MKNVLRTLCKFPVIAILSIALLLLELITQILRAFMKVIIAVMVWVAGKDYKAIAEYRNRVNKDAIKR